MVFDQGDPEDFLLLISSFNMNPKALGTIVVSAKMQYLHTLICREVLSQFDTLSAEVGSTTS